MQKLLLSEPQTYDPKMSRLAHGMYGFRHFTPSTDQSIEGIKSYLDLICNVFKDWTLSNTEVNAGAFDYSASEHATLKAALEATTGENGLMYVKRWYPAYACAIIFYENPRLYGKVDIKVIGLDSWERKVQQGSDGKSHHFATPKTFLVDSFGIIETCQVDSIMYLFQSFFDTAINESQQNRGKRGHQKTASFIHVLLKDAVEVADKFQGNLDDIKDAIERQEIVDPKNSPKGAITDVGLHTGGNARHTCWSLVKFTLLYFLNNDSLFGRVMLCINLYVHLNLSVRPTVVFDPKHSIDEPYIALNAAIDIVTNREFSDSLDCSDLDLFIEMRHAALKKVVCDYSQNHSQEFTLPDDISTRDAVIHPPYIFKPSVAGIVSLSQIREKALLNSEWLPVFSMRNGSFALMEKYLADISDRNGIKEMALLALSTVERFVFEKSKLLDPKIYGATFNIPQPEINAMFKVLEWYQATVVMLKSSSFLMQTMLMSSATIVSWVMLCLVHKQAIYFLF